MIEVDRPTYENSPGEFKAVERITFVCRFTEKHCALAAVFGCKLITVTAGQTDFLVK